jgi:hypothetical protein
VIILLEEGFKRLSQFRDAAKGHSVDDLFLQRPEEMLCLPV